MSRRHAGVAALAAAAGLATTVGAAHGASSVTGRLSIVYDTTAATRHLVYPRSRPGLSPQRGVVRQDPGAGGMFAPGNNNRYRVGRICGAVFQSMSAGRMAATLRQQIAHGSYGASSHLVAIDELTEAYGEPPPPHARRSTRLPRVSPNSPGARLTTAMRSLARQQSPWGGTWASRVQIYVSPGIVTSIALGRGPLHNLSPAGRPQYRTWRAVMPGLALAGGLHLEMYHGSGRPLAAFTARQWRTAPGAFLSLLSKYRGMPSRVHFVISSTTRPAGTPRGWGNAMEATWSLARSTAAGRTILNNGPDAYRLGGMATQWLIEYDRQFPA